MLHLNKKKTGVSSVRGNTRFLVLIHIFKEKNEKSSKIYNIQLSGLT
jgi:hypothetical protein